MTVCAMRLTETMTIYLAAGAPFGVSAYLREQSQTSGEARRLARAAAATLFWPVALMAILFRSNRHPVDDEAVDTGARRESKIDESTRAFMRSVQKTLELARTPQRRAAEMERTLYALRESVEQYVGLARSQAEEDFDGAPVKHEMELNHIAGRRGDDLIVAGRCVHRRNVSRLIARRRRARTRLLHALAELRVEEGNFPDGDGAGERMDGRREMAEARLEIFNRAIDLLSLLDDTSAVACAARLMDAECSRLRRLQEANRGEALECASMEKRCTEQRPQLIFRDRPRETTFSQG